MKGTPCAIALACALAGSSAWAGTGQITGTIVDEATRLPLAGMCAEAYGSAAPSEFTSAPSGSDGTYTISGLDPDAFQVIAFDCTPPVDYALVEYRQRHRSLHGVHNSPLGARLVRLRRAWSELSPPPRPSRPGPSPRCRVPRRSPRRCCIERLGRPACTTARRARAWSRARRGPVGSRSARTRPARSPRAPCRRRARSPGYRSAGAGSPPSGGELPGLLDDVLDRAHHVEGLLGQVVVLALDDLAEAADGLGQRNVDALESRELLGDVERLRQEALDLAGARHREFVVFRQLVHAEDGDDVLQVFVALQHHLHLARHLVVLLADDVRVEDARRGVERVHRRIDALLGDRAAQRGRGVEMGERGGGRWIGEIVGGDVDGLHRGDRPALRGGDALLQLADVGAQRRLIADGGRHAAEQRRDLRVRLHEAKDVVDEEEDVLALLVAEVLGDGERAETDARARAGRLVHLPVDQRRARNHRVAVRELRLLHLEVEVVALARALAHPAEHRHAGVLLGDVVDQLHDDHRLAHARATEQADLPAALIRGEQVHHLDAGLEGLDLRLLVGERGRLAMDRCPLLGGDRTFLIHGLPDHVHDASERRLADGHGDGLAHVADLRRPPQAGG